MPNAIKWSDFSYETWLENPLCCSAPQWALELSKRDYKPVSAREFYTDIFRLSELSTEQGGIEPHRTPDDYKQGEYGIIAHEINIPNHKTKRITITNDGERLWELIDNSNKFCLMRPISYAGRSATLENARFMFALCIEVDDIEDSIAIDELSFKWRRNVQKMPRPTYIVCSGTGLHLYFCFYEPVPMFQKFRESVNAARQWLIPWFWDRGVSTSRPQFEGVNQGFRVVGTLAKDKKTRAMAFRVGEKYTIAEFNEYLPKHCQISQFYESTLTIADAMQRYPEWYLRRVVRREPPGTYKRNRAVYDSWKNRIIDGAHDHHRYNCLEALCALAVQCDISREELLRDCEELAELFETRTERPNNHFTQYDVLCALSTYDRADTRAYLRNLDIIEIKTDIRLPRSRHNGRNQKQHLKIARAVRDALHDDWRAGNGRPDKRALVEAYFLDHPDANISQASRELKIDRKTVRKWKK